MYGLDAEFFRIIQILGCILYTAAAVVFALFLWLCVSLVSTTPPHRLRRPAALFAWIALPSVPALVGYEFDVQQTAPAIGYIGLALLLWTDVFAALAIGVVLSGLVPGTSNRPPVLSLPIAVFAFSALSAAALALLAHYGTFPRTMDCTHPPYEFPSNCEYFHDEGLYISAGLGIMVIMCGFLLPATSNLVRLYPWHRSVFHHSRLVEAGQGHVAPSAAFDDRLKEVRQALRAKRQEFDI